MNVPPGTLLANALADLRAGKPVLLYDSDGREGETDIVYASEHVTAEAIRVLRTDGGGLVCTALAPEFHEALGLPFLADLLEDATASNPVLASMKANDMRYDPSRSSFGLTVNHRRTFTGIPDADRALTIRELAAFAKGMVGKPTAAAQAEFGASFRAPGHVILLNGHPRGLAARQGHTELSLELARLAGCVPSTTICEMLDPASGRALGKKEAQAYAASKGLVFLTGQDVLEAWQTNAARTRTPGVPALGAQATHPAPGEQGRALRAAASA